MKDIHDLIWLALVLLALVAGFKAGSKNVRPHPDWIDVEVVHRGETVTFWVRQNIAGYGRSGIDTALKGAQFTKQDVKISSKFGGVGGLQVFNRELTFQEMDAVVMGDTEIRDGHSDAYNNRFDTEWKIESIPDGHPIQHDGNKHDRDDLRH